MTIMWCSRFVGWKHPELAIMMAARLKEKGYNFMLDMYGSGSMFSKALQLTNDLGINDVVNLTI